MGSQYTRADSLYEFLSGATSDGGAQTNPNNSLGQFRSSTEAVSLGITVSNPITGVSPLFAGGGNPVGDGTLTAIDTTHLTWAPNGQAAGLPKSFSGTSTEVVEGPSPGQYLRISGTTPFTPGLSTITLSYLINNQFGMDDVTIAEATAGESEYRASLVVNESSRTVSAWQRWIGTMGTQQISSGGVLGASGSGSISTSGSFADWPDSGWCNITTNTGTLREVVYYTSRTNTILTVPAAGRGRLGTTPGAGAASDVVNAVPGVAIAIDTAGVQAGGSSIQTIANANAAPASVTWCLGITPSTGLQIGTVPAGYEVGIWQWREIPVGAIATPQSLILFNNSFDAF